MATLRARGPYPLLAISGELGSAKTVLSKMLKALIDTSAAPVRALPREERELMIAANNGYLLAFDKLSGLPAWLSDALGERREFRGAAALYRRRRGRSPGRLHLRKHGRLAIVQNISQQHSTERAFNKLTRTFATQMEALKRYRIGGEQKVTVLHARTSCWPRGRQPFGLRASENGKATLRLWMRPCTWVIIVVARENIE